MPFLSYNSVYALNIVFHFDFKFWLYEVAKEIIYFGNIKILITFSLKKYLCN